ncbi:MAG: hypothetical protein AB1671_21325 [Thermodesulfobacteriota bacterium]|jgi:hypothetical protein
MTKTHKLTWKLARFYDLPLSMLTRLSHSYGLTTLGGLADINETGSLEIVRRRLLAVVGEESNPRVRRCLAHQFILAHKVLILRARGVRARVRGWLVEIDGGKGVRPPQRSLV